jgi:hypothetical protein
LTLSCFSKLIPFRFQRITRRQEGGAGDVLYKRSRSRRRPRHAPGCVANKVSQRKRIGIIKRKGLCALSYLPFVESIYQNYRRSITMSRLQLIPFAKLQLIKIQLLFNFPDNQQGIHTGYRAQRRKFTGSHILRLHYSPGSNHHNGIEIRQIGP